MRPDASRLVYRIKTALKGESNGLETANLAWQYAKEVDLSLAILKQCLETESNLEAYVTSCSNPSVLDTLDSLDFAGAKDWSECCEKFSWRKADEIDPAQLKKLQERFSQIENSKTWLQGEFRAKVRAKKPLEAYQIASLICEKFEADANLASELERLKSQVIDQAESELSSALQELMPTEAPEAIVARYCSYGIELPDKEGPIKTVLLSMAENAVLDSTAAVESLIEQAKSSNTVEEKSALEETYFKCDYQLTLTDTRSKIDPKLRDAYSAVVTEISHHRAGNESNLLIQHAIDDLRKVLQGLSISFGRKKATVHDARERLKSFEAQAKRMGRRIPAAIQEDIKKALSEATRKRAPKYAILASGTLAILTVIGWIAYSQVKNNQYSETLQIATAALNQAAANQDIEQAERALVERNELVTNAPSRHAIKQAAGSLQRWITDQKSLQKEYADIADRLDSIRGSENADPNAPEIDALLGKAMTTLAAIDVELKNDSETRITRFESWRKDRISEQLNDRKQVLLGYVREAQNNLEQAAAASNDTEFETSSRAIVESIASARLHISQFPDSDQNSLQHRSIGRIEESLKSIQGKRDTMLAAQKSIKGADDLVGYLKSLEAIYNFETLPPDGKRNIGRILKLENQYKSLMQNLIMPGNPKGWEALSDASNFVAEKQILDEAETAFVERMINNPLFPTIYESKVKYFEGAPVAKNEYSVFLADPIQKGDKAGLKTGINFSFKVRGFDESGDAEEDALEMNFLSHPDGTFWGFFYEPSEMSKESIYYQESLRVSFMKILAGAPRFFLLELIDELTSKRTLSPAFRAYWQQQLIEFIGMNPWKWGMSLSPELENQIESFENLDPEGIDKQQWLSTVEQISPSVLLTEHFRIASKTKVADEAKAFVEFYSYAKAGEMKLIGQANESGEIEYEHPRLDDEKVWIVNGLTGRIERFEAETNIAPYAPVIAYRFEDQPASRVIQKTEMRTGIDLSSNRYSQKLPPLFK